MAPIATPKPLATGIAKPPASVAPKMKKAATIATKNSDKSKATSPTTPTKPSTSCTQEAPSTATKTRPRTPQVPKTPAGTKKVASPSITKSSKKPSWKRRPKAAHSGVPIPDKLRKLLAQEGGMKF